MISELVKEDSYKNDFVPFADISDRAAWEALPPEMKDSVTENGLQYLGYRFPQIPLSLYREFSSNGNRTRCEDKVFQRRYALDALVLAGCFEGNGRFMDDILDGIYCIMEESTWCVSAHNTYIRDTPQSPIPDYSNPVIDLFAGESGATLALAEYLLRPEFEKISPFISRDIDFRLRERIFIPYLNRHFWWMGDGKEQMNNWTVWITQNVMLAAFTRPDSVLSREEKSCILAKAARSVDYFLEEYGEDGCCSEGAHYYGHAGVALFHCLRIMNQVTDNGLQAVFREKKIRNIADYIRKVHITEDVYVNFADCPARCSRRGAGEYLFGKATDQPELCAFAAADLKKNPDPLLTGEESLYRRLLQITTWEEMTGANTAASIAAGGCVSESAPGAGSPGGPADAWFESTGVMTARDGRLFLAVKAGENGDSHNHNDVGSFIVFRDGRPLFIDLGVETYCKKTFSERRYEIWTMQSQYHNLPSFGGFIQQAGAEYAASDVSCTITDREASLSMEIAGAYRRPGEDTGCIRQADGTLALKDGAAGIRSYRRKAVLTRGENIRIEDVYDGDLPAVLNLMVCFEPSIEQTGEDAWELSLDGERACLIQGASAVSAEEIYLEDEKLKSCWGQRVFRIQVRMERRLALTII